MGVIGLTLLHGSFRKLKEVRHCIACKKKKINAYLALVVSSIWDSYEFCGTCFKLKLKASLLHANFTLHIWRTYDVSVVHLWVIWSWMSVDYDEGVCHFKLMNKNHGLCENSFLLTTWCSNVCGCRFCKPSRDFTRSLGMPRGLKGLLHMLNATVSPTTEDFYLLLSCYF